MGGEAPHPTRTPPNRHPPARSVLVGELYEWRYAGIAGAVYYVFEMEGAVLRRSRMTGKRSLREILESIDTWLCAIWLLLMFIMLDLVIMFSKLMGR